MEFYLIALSALTELYIGVPQLARKSLKVFLKNSISVLNFLRMTTHRGKAVPGRNDSTEQKQNGYTHTTCFNKV